MISKLASIIGKWEVILVLLIIAVLVLGTFLSPFFLSVDNLLSQTRSFIVVGFLALGLTVVVITGEIDLSGESVLAVCAVVFGLLFERGINIWAAGLLVVLLGMLIGLMNGILTVGVGLPSLVVTLASLISFRGLAFVLLERRPITGFPDFFIEFGNGNIGATQIPQTLVVFGAIALFFFVLVHLTVWGRRLFSIGANSKAAALSGVPVQKIKITTFVLSGAMAGCSALVLAARYGSVRADAGQGLILSVLTVVLLGGISIFGGSGNLIGVVLSLILVGLIQNGMSLANIPSELQNLLVGCLLIVTVIIPRTFLGMKRSPPVLRPDS